MRVIEDEDGGEDIHEYVHHGVRIDDPNPYSLHLRTTPEVVGTARVSILIYIDSGECTEVEMDEPLPLKALPYAAISSELVCELIWPWECAGDGHYTVDRILSLVAAPATKLEVRYVLDEAGKHRIHFELRIGEKFSTGTTVDFEKLDGFYTTEL